MNMKITAMFSLLLLVLPAVVFAQEPNSEGWYLDEEPFVLENFVLEEQLQNMFESKVQSCLDISIPEVSALSDALKGDYFVSIYDAREGLTRSVSSDKAEEVKIQEGMKNGHLEIALYAKTALYTERLPAAFVYHEDWPVLHVPAIEMNHEWFCAGFVHELYHWQQHQLRKNEVLPQNETLGAWLGEEVLAHELERKVLNALTEGKYVAALDVYVERNKAKGLSEIQKTMQVTLPFAVKSLFKKQTAVEKNISLAQIIVDASFMFVDKQNGTFEEKIAIYNDLLSRNQ